jgi:hypothetical protein
MNENTTCYFVTTYKEHLPSKCKALTSKPQCFSSKNILQKYSKHPKHPRTSSQTHSNNV